MGSNFFRPEHAPKVAVVRGALVLSSSMSDQSAVAMRHIGSRALLSGPIDSLAGVIPDELDAGALCYVIENLTLYQWQPDDATAASSPGVIRPTGRNAAGAWIPVYGGPTEAVVVSVAVPALVADTSDDGTRVTNPFTRAIAPGSIILAQFQGLPATGVAITAVFVIDIPPAIGLMFSNTSTGDYGGGNIDTMFALFAPAGT